MTVGAGVTERVGRGYDRPVRRPWPPVWAPTLDSEVAAPIGRLRPRVDVRTPDGWRHRPEEPS